MEITLYGCLSVWEIMVYLHWEGYCMVFFSVFGFIWEYEYLENWCSIN